MLETIIIVVCAPFVSALQPMPGGWRTVLRKDDSDAAGKEQPRPCLYQIRQQYQG